MAMKGHKRGCGYVGCSPATRKRGMAALKKQQASAGKGRAKPKSGGRSNPKAEEVGQKVGQAARKAASGAKKAASAVGRGAKAAARAAVCSEGTRENGRKPGIAGHASPKGSYIVLRRVSGRVTSMAVFGTRREAEEAAGKAAGATIARVESNWE